MENKDSYFRTKNSRHQSNELKNRLFEKGIGHSSVSSFKSPLASDQANRILLVNLTSSTSSKFSPKVIRKQTAGLPRALNQSGMGSNFLHIKDHIKTEGEFNKSQTFKNEKLKAENFYNQKAFTSNNFFNSSSRVIEKKSPQILSRTENSKSPELCSSLTFQRTKNLVEKLSGKSHFATMNDDRSHMPQQVSPARSPRSDDERPISPDTHSPLAQQEEIQVENKMTLDSYINRALKNEPHLEQFLYLVNSKYVCESEKNKDDPYDLRIVNYDASKNIESSFAHKYYTVSKKGLCYYVNGKPIDFIDLEEWVSEKQSYNKIKSLKFFNRFRRWKTVKMWRKIVLKHRLEQCSKNLEEKLFFLNPTMRACLFEIQEISLEMGKNMVIIKKNHGDYSLENFKLIQEKTKREMSSIIEDHSRASRSSVNKCFDENLRTLRAAIKEKEELEEKTVMISAHMNIKDSAFQALGFPAKMSYENRSKLRKMAGRFIRFSYLVDMIHTAGIAESFSSKMKNLIKSLERSQEISCLQVVMNKEDPKNPNDMEEENPKLVSIKLFLNDDPSKLTLRNTEQRTIGPQDFYPFYNVRLFEEPNPVYRQFCPTITEEWIEIKPNFYDVSDELNFHIKQSLNCLKFFERWSKHRDMEKYIKILEEWDDTVSENREIAQNQNLDPVSIISDFQSSLANIKDIIFKSMGIIKSKIGEELTEYVNVHWEYIKLNLQKFSSQRLVNPAETVEDFLKHLTTQIQFYEKKIPLKIKLGIFEVGLEKVKSELLIKAKAIYEEFKEMLPDIVEERTKYLNSWLEKYNEVIKEEVINIDDFVGKVLHIKQIEQTFQVKKELCQNLSCIYSVMECYKLDVKKRKDFQSVTLKLKDQLEQEMSNFEQSFERQSQIYSREVNKNYLPSLIKDAKKLSQIINNDKYLSYSFNQGRDNQSIIREIKDLQAKFADLHNRNLKCSEYQLILRPQAQADEKTGSNPKPGQPVANQEEEPTYQEQIRSIKETIESLLTMWELMDEWDHLIELTNNETVETILERREEISNKIASARGVIKNKLKSKLKQDNQVLLMLEKKVEILGKNLPVILCLNSLQSECHWEEVIGLVHRNQQSSHLDVRNFKPLKFSEMVNANMGDLCEQFEEIFVKATNEVKVQEQYNELQKKWQTKIVKIKVDGKYQTILDEEEHQSILEFFDDSIQRITEIMSNPYSTRIKTNTVTYPNLRTGLAIYELWSKVQKDLILFDRICRSIDIKKLQEPSLLENAEKIYKNFFKLLLARNMENGFNLKRFISSGNMQIYQKLEQCSKLLFSLQTNIKNLLQDYRKTHQIFYQLTDNELISVIISSINSLNNHINSGNSLLQSQGSVLKYLICEKFMPHSIKDFVLDGERITEVVSMDGENLLKNSISYTLELEVVLEQIMTLVSEHCRKMMRACRVKNVESSVMEILPEFNLQFLLAIHNIDFSHYTSISIENRQENSQSLKDYLKIMRKDNQSFTSQLRKHENPRIAAIIKKYETILLQSLVHEKMLEKLVKEDISCANEYSWVNQLKFVWEDNASLEESNISIKKMHVSLRYGKEYIGSNTPVLMDNEHASYSELMIAIKYSELCRYQGNLGRMTNFFNAIAHHLQIIDCTNETTLALIYGVMKAREKMDCCFYLRHGEYLREEVLAGLAEMKQSSNIYTESFFQTHSGNSNSNCLCNPIFLSMSSAINNSLTSNRFKFRTFSLAAPNPIFLSNSLRISQTISERIRNFGVESPVKAKLKTLSSSHPSRKNSSLLVNSKIASEQGCENEEGESRKISQGQFLLALFNLLEELEGEDAGCVEDFLADHREWMMANFQQINNEMMKKAQISSCIMRTNQDLCPDTSPQINSDPVDYFLTHFLTPTKQFKPETIQTLRKYIQEVYCSNKKTTLANGVRKQTIQGSPQLSVKIKTGLNDCLVEEINRSQKYESNVSVVNIYQYSEDELYGDDKCYGVLDQIVYCLRPEEMERKGFLKEIDKIAANSKNFNASMVNDDFNLATMLPHPTKRSKNEKKNSLFQQCQHLLINGSQIESPSRGGTLIIKGINQRIINYLHHLLHSFDFEKVQTRQVYLLANEISTIIDPKILTSFHPEHIKPNHSYLEEKVESWLSRHFDSPLLQDSLSPSEEKDKVIRDHIHKFVHKIMFKFFFKTLFSLQSESTQVESDERDMGEKRVYILTDFLMLFETLLPEVRENVFCEKKVQVENFGNQKGESKEAEKNKLLITQACVYCLCHASTLYIARNMSMSMNSLEDPSKNFTNQSQIFGKVNGMMKKMLPENCVPEKANLFSYLFNGRKLIPIEEYFNKEFIVPNGGEKDRALERGQYYLTDEMIHYNLIAERTLRNTKYGVKVMGPKISGKSTFGKIYKILHHDSDCAFLSINLFGKDKSTMMNKLRKVINMKNRDTFTAKLNYNCNVIFIDDVNMENSSREAESIEIALESMIGGIISLRNSHSSAMRRFLMKDTKFILSEPQKKRQNKSNLSLLENYTIKCWLGLNQFENSENSMRSSMNSFTNDLFLPLDPHSPALISPSMKTIFTEILKANILDSEVSENLSQDLINLTFSIYTELTERIRKKIPTYAIPAEYLKSMVTFTSHLRFKPTNSSMNELERFWAFLIKDKFQPIALSQNIQFCSLKCLSAEQSMSQSASTLRIIENLNEPLQKIIYSHMHIKQQQYGNGKELEHVRDMKRLYNIINENIEKYNEIEVQENKNGETGCAKGNSNASKKKYGHNFDFVSIDEIVIRIIRMSNRLIRGDYGIVGRKGSEIQALVRLVSYLQGFKYQEKPESISLTELVKGIILELTKVSSYLIAVKVRTEQDFEELAEFYDSDFEMEMVLPVLWSELEPSSSPNPTQTTSRPGQLNQSNNNRTMASKCKVSPGKGVASSTINHTSSNSNVSDLTQPSHNTPRIVKPNHKEIHKIKRSIRVVAQFERDPTTTVGAHSEKRWKFRLNENVLSQINLDFFQEYPQESIVRFSKQILELSSIQYDDEVMNCIYQIYRHTRASLGISLKEYEECIQLYSNLIFTFPDELKGKSNKTIEILDMHDKIKAVILKQEQKLEELRERKMMVTEKLSRKKKEADQMKMKGNEDEEDSAQSGMESDKLEEKLQQINQELQEVNLTKCQCDKIICFLVPSYHTLKERQVIMNYFLTNQNALKKLLGLISSYFTYLSPLNYVKRKPFLESWLNLPQFQQLNEGIDKINEEREQLYSVEQEGQEKKSRSKRKVETKTNKNIGGVSNANGNEMKKMRNNVVYLFEIIREEDFVISQSDEKYYQNMTILLESIKPVIIKDSKMKGRNWLRNFDASFATVTESSPNFYQKLGEYLTNGHNILIELTQQSTIDNMQSNFINSLIFLSESTKAVEINGEEINVNKESKVYIVINSQDSKEERGKNKSPHHLLIPEQIKSEYLFLTYEDDEEDLISSISKDLMIAHNHSTYQTNEQFTRKCLSLTNQCSDYKMRLCNTLHHALYESQEESEENSGSSEKQLEEKAGEDNVNANVRNAQEKTEEEIIDFVRRLNKGPSDQLQEILDKYFGRKKLLPDMKEKVDKNQPMTEQIGKLLQIIRVGFYLVGNLFQWSKNGDNYSDIEYYYDVMVKAVKKGYSKTPGILILFMLKQWGFRLDYETLLSFALTLTATAQSIVKEEDPSRLSPHKYLLLIKRFTAQVLSKSVFNQDEGIIAIAVEGQEEREGEGKHDDVNWRKSEVQNPPILTTLAMMVKDQEFGFTLEEFEDLIAASIFNLVNDTECLHWDNLWSPSKSSSEGLKNLMGKGIMETSYAQLIDHIVILTGNIEAVNEQQLERQKLQFKSKHQTPANELDEQQGLKTPGRNDDDENVATENKIVNPRQGNLFNNALQEQSKGKMKQKALMKFIGEQICKNSKILPAWIKSFDNIEPEVKKSINERSSFMILAEDDDESSVQGFSDKLSKNLKNCHSQRSSSNRSILEQCLKEMTKYTATFAQKMKSEEESNTKSNYMSIMLKNNNSSNALIEGQNSKKIDQSTILYIYCCSQDLSKTLNSISRLLELDQKCISRNVSIRNIENEMKLLGKVHHKLEETFQRNILANSYNQSIDEGSQDLGQAIANMDNAFNKKKGVTIVNINNDSKSKNPSKQASNSGTIKNLSTMKRIEKINPSIKNILNPDLLNAIADPLKHKICEVSQLTMEIIVNSCLRKEGLLISKKNVAGKDKAKYLLLNLTSAFISPNIIRGIHNIMQPISAENENWGFRDAIKVICSYLLDWLETNHNFYDEKQAKEIIREILKLAQENTHKSLTEKSLKNSVNNLKKDHEEENDANQINKDEMLLQKIKKLFLPIEGEEVRKIEGTIWEEYFAQSQYILFKHTFLSKMRKYLGLNKSSRVKKVDSINKLLTLSTQNSTKNLPKRSSRKSNLLDLSTVSNLKKKINHHNHNSQFKKTLEISNNNSNNNNNNDQTKTPSEYDCLKISLQESHDDELSKTAEMNETQLPTIASHLLYCDINRIEAKINILKADYDQNLFDKVHLLSESVKENGCFISKSKKYDIVESIYNWKLASQNILPTHWRMFIHEECKNDKKNQNGLSLTHSLLNLMKKKNGLYATMKRLQNNKLYPVELEVLSQPTRFIKAYLVDEFIAQNKEKPLEENSMKSQQPSSKVSPRASKKTSRNPLIAANSILPNQENVYYVITMNPTQEQIQKNSNRYIKIKNLYMMGWKMNGQGILELSNDDKINAMSNVCILKKAKPQQMGICRVAIADGIHRDGKISENKLNLHVLCKKIIDLKGKELKAGLSLSL